jgi:hypothetical protein
MAQAINKPEQSYSHMGQLAQDAIPPIGGFRIDFVPHGYDNSRKEFIWRAVVERPFSFKAGGKPFFGTLNSTFAHYLKMFRDNLRAGSSSQTELRVVWATSDHTPHYFWTPDMVKADGEPLKPQLTTREDMDNWMRGK